MVIPKEILSILGIGVIGFIGSTVLISVGQPNLAKVLDIILMIAATIIGIKYVYDGARAVATIFQITL